jgi:hypothetical protein
MKHLTFIITLLLLCIVFPTSLAARHGVPRYLNKESAVDMSKMNRVFVGWIDLEPDAWALYGFANKTEWTNIIGSLNATFARSLQVSYLPGRTITAAKNNSDENATGNDLYIKFSDVQVAYNDYHLILSIHFIDPKTNAELATIPVRPYHDDEGDVKDYVKSALDEVGKKLQVEVTNQSPGKKRKRE